MEQDRKPQVHAALTSNSMKRSRKTYVSPGATRYAVQALDARRAQDPAGSRREQCLMVSERAGA